MDARPVRRPARSIVQRAGRSSDRVRCFWARPTCPRHRPATTTEVRHQRPPRELVRGEHRRAGRSTPSRGCTRHRAPAPASGAARQRVVLRAGPLLAAAGGGAPPSGGDRVPEPVRGLRRALLPGGSLPRGGGRGFRSRCTATGAPPRGSMEAPPAAARPRRRPGRPVDPAACRPRAGGERVARRPRPRCRLRGPVDRFIAYSDYDEFLALAPAEPPDAPRALFVACSSATRRSTSSSMPGRSSSSASLTHG